MDGDNLFVYTRKCSVCGQEKPFAELTLYHGKPQKLCRSCCREKGRRKYKKKLQPNQKHPWILQNDAEIIKFRLGKSLKD